ncbi:hypothetical protein [Halobellus ruber]|nr:hypothetical protein [Halobellus ruber]
MTVDYSLTDFANDAAEFDLDFSVKDATDGSVEVVDPEVRWTLE